MCLLFTNLKIKAAMFYHFLPGLQSSHTKRLTCTKFKPSTRVLISFTRAIFFDSSNLVILTVKFTFSCFAFGASSSSSLLRKKTQKNRIIFLHAMQPGIFLALAEFQEKTSTSAN